MPEVRLIDANALKAKLKIYTNTATYSDYCNGYCDARQFDLDAIDAAPTIEPEVRHGRMIEGRYPNENKCSECGQTFRDDIGFIIQDDDGVFHYPKRCPECGCYWDGGADNG